MGSATAGRRDFEFSYRLTGRGWAEGHVSDGVTHLNPTASYLSDSLRQLLEAVAIVTEGATEARCSWDEEPGEFRWAFARTGDRLAIRILWFDDLWTDASDAEGTVVFQTTQPVLRVARSVLSAAQQVVDDLGEEGYERQWVQHPFPNAALDRLRRAIATDRQRSAPLPDLASRPADPRP